MVQVPYTLQFKSMLQNDIKLPYYFILREYGPRRMPLAGAVTKDVFHMSRGMST